MKPRSIKHLAASTRHQNPTSHCHSVPRTHTPHGGSNPTEQPLPPTDPARHTCLGPFVGVPTVGVSPAVVPPQPADPAAARHAHGRCQGGRGREALVTPPATPTTALAAEGVGAHHPVHGGGPRYQCIRCVPAGAGQRRRLFCRLAAGAPRAPHRCAGGGSGAAAIAALSHRPTFLAGGRGAGRLASVTWLGTAWSQRPRQPHWCGGRFLRSPGASAPPLLALHHRHAAGAEVSPVAPILEDHHVAANGHRRQGSGVRAVPPPCGVRLRAQRLDARRIRKSRSHRPTRGCQVCTCGGIGLAPVRHDLLRVGILMGGPADGAAAAAPTATGCTRSHPLGSPPRHHRRKCPPRPGARNEHLGPRQRAR